LIVRRFYFLQERMKERTLFFPCNTLLNSIHYFFEKNQFNKLPTIEYLPVNETYFFSHCVKD